MCSRHAQETRQFSQKHNQTMTQTRPKQLTFPYSNLTQESKANLTNQKVNCVACKEKRDRNQNRRSNPKKTKLPVVGSVAACKTARNILKPWKIIKKSILPRCKIVQVGTSCKRCKSKSRNYRTVI